MMPSKPVRARPAPAATRPLAWTWLEGFVILQFLSPALLFLPGAQSFRFAIRALPFVASLACWVFLASSARARPRFPSRGAADPPAPPLPGPNRSGPWPWLVACLAAYPVGFLHPDSVLASAVAQFVFQLAIVGPAFWAWRLVREPNTLDRFFWVVLCCNVASAGVGALQVYFPDRWMPPEFSRVGLAMNQYWVESLSYIGTKGQRIIRPPGLSDQPGGAAGAAMIAGILGMILATRPSFSWSKRAFCLGAAALGMFVLYICQVRSLFLVMIAGTLVAGLVLVRSGHFQRAAALAGLGTMLVTTTFGWAVSVGGKAVFDRFMGIRETGVVESFQRNRGIFLEYTLEELLFDYPLGAGVGRWGMMNVYSRGLGDRTVDPIHVEIQLTGWLVDGGWPLLLCSCVAVGLALQRLYRLAVAAPNLEVAYAGTVAFSFGLAVAAQSFAGPVFNTQAGIMFWLIFSVVTRADQLSHLPQPQPPTPPSAPPTPSHKRFLTRQPPRPRP